MSSKTAPNGAPTEGFAVWRIVVWLLLALAAFGCVQYAVHGHQLWNALQGTAAQNDEARSQLHRMLAWNVGYFVAALAIVVISAGVILRQGWSRPAMQVVAVVLALGWGLAGGLSALSKWQEFSDAITPTIAQSPVGAIAQAMYDQARHTFMINLGLRAVAIPVLLWLAWWLGRPAVRAQFRTRPVKS
ncbi:hypothetical protein DVT68_08530 [Dyella solisilvae]|uniref:Uncharacterized protein n=1 Tax=Dyella solisilvae TaxID=1920168 RepID=A0A370K7E4_9GAMM|nr:hypothetical protein [Dyella solisilvae]RDI98566.1 hypothetical protein DVT68_08530 [Dyella solisilvae]